MGSILATFALGASAYGALGKGWNAMLLPVAIAVVGVLCSILGTFLIRTKEDATQKSLLATLRGHLPPPPCAVLAAPLTWFILGGEYMGVYVAILAGLVAGCAIGYFTEYYTSDTYKPTQTLADSTETGAATTIMRHLPGHEVTAAPSSSSPSPSSWPLSAGGSHPPTAPTTPPCSARVSTASASPPSACSPPWASPWPPTPTARGRQRRRHRRMSGLGEEVRADRRPGLLGNTTAHRQGLRHRLRALTALALLVSYVDVVNGKLAEMGDGHLLDLSLTNPAVLVGLFIGAMLTFMLPP